MLRFPFFIASTALLLASAVGAAALDEREILNDPEWKRRFLGSYGFLSGAEPEIRADELNLLRDVIDLMKANPRAAATMLESQIGEGSSASLDFILANLEFQNGRLEQAEAHYRNALKKFPDFRRGHKNLGLLLVQQGKHGEAVGHLTRAVELGDRDGRNFGLIGYCYINLDNPLVAEEAYRSAILQEPETRDWKLGLARALLAMEQYKEAVALFGSLIDEDPEDWTSWMLQANAFIGLDQPTAAAVNLEAVRMLGKAETSSLVLLGDIYMNEGMTDLATSAYQEVIERDAKGVRFETAVRAGDLLLRSGAHEDAARILGSIDTRYKGLSKDSQLEVLTLKARLARAQGRKKEAAELLESIVSQDGTRGDALLELAAYYHEKGEAERAVLLLEQAQNLRDYEYRALLEHAKFKVAARDYRAAAELLRSALEIEREPRVERFLARVEQAVRAQ